MGEYRLRGDRTIDSTDTNEFATDLRDETILPDDLIEEKPLSDYIPDGVNEAGENARPIYNEMGMDDDHL